MSEISDDLRAAVNMLFLNGSNGYNVLMDLAERIDSEMIELPRDADGVPIHVGDVMWQKDRITKRTCKAIMGDVYVMLDGIQGAVYAKGLTHYHEPTVEDVLREFTDEVWNRCCEGATASDSGIDELVAECAAKLRLAGENA